MSAISLTGKSISVGDRVTVLGNIVSVSSNQNNATVVVQLPLSASTVSVLANECLTPNSNTTEGGGATGNKLAAGQDCTVTGLVTAISGSGNTATLAVSTTVNGTSISVPSGACYSDNV